MVFLWLYDTRDVEENLFDEIVASLFENGKITKFSYNIFRVKDRPSDTEMFCYDALNVDDDVDWGIIHEIILIVVSKYSWEHYISRFFIKQFAPINFLLKLVLLFVIFVKKLMRPWCIYFVNVGWFNRFHTKQKGG